jgi:hypothetical protein
MRVSLFLVLSKDADRDIPILKEAEAEYAHCNRRSLAKAYLMRRFSRSCFPSARAADGRVDRSSLGRILNPAHCEHKLRLWLERFLLENDLLQQL